MSETPATSTPETDDDFAADLYSLISGGVKKGPICTVALMLETHTDPAKAARIRDLIDDPGVVATKLAEFCAKHGGVRPAKDNAIRRHRKRGFPGGCGCDA